MNRTLSFLIIAIFCLTGLGSAAQAEGEKLNLPGDNLNLYAALKLFQESPTLESFEQALNDEKSNINNLDLNGDNKIDYILVEDNPEGNVHNIVLKTAVSKTEDQDIAVFVVNRESDDKVQIQVIGNEDLYGKDYIIEPDFETGSEAAGTPNPGYTGDEANGNENTAIVNTSTTEIASWPIVRFVFVPAYTSWRSPWHWGYYPSYWRPWRPFFWHYYYGYHYHWNYFYNRHYRRWHNYRVPGWREQYYGGPFRSRSALVRTRYDRGDFRKTYSRPDLAIKGAAVFKRDFPKAPTVNNRLPAFDKTGRPLVSRPPTIKPVTKPITEAPVADRPGIEKPATTRPGVTRPVIEKPVVTRPVTRPIETRPATRPVVAKPITTPVTEPTTTPVTRPPINRPVTRPVTRPIETRPVTKPVTTPVTRPTTTRPVTRPATRPAHNQPVNRTPAAPATVTPGTAKPVKE